MGVIVGLGFGAATGALLRRWCVGKRYDWELDAPDPEALPASDSWSRHLFAILFAGAAAGLVLAVLRDRMEYAHFAASAGLLCAVLFLPVCAAVLNAARRAQRGRLGSLVAGADRRAVWGILSTTLLVATLEGLPDWPAPQSGLSGPAPAAALIVAALSCIVIVLAADLNAHRRAKQAIAPGLVRHESDDRGVDAEDAPRLDLGIGNELHAHLHRGAAAYRSRNRALSLVQGDPERAVAALRRAIGRGVVGLGVACAVVMAHAAADSQLALAYYQELRCAMGVEQSCGDAVVNGLSGGDLDRANAIVLFSRSCDRGDGRSCMSIADLYRGSAEADRDAGMVAFFEYRAAQRGLCPEGQRLARSRGNVCVAPDDPRGDVTEP